MTSDPTMRIVWYQGHAYGVSNSPPGEPTAGFWYVLTGGEWQRLFPNADADEWEQIEPRVLRWLEQRETTT